MRVPFSKVQNTRFSFQQNKKGKMDFMPNSSNHHSKNFVQKY